MTQVYPKVLCFYSHYHDQTYGAFSNFYDAPVIYKGKTWPTSEHTYQAMKFWNPAQSNTAQADIVEKIRNAPSPAIAKKMGQEKGLRKDWDNVYSVSKDRKFAQTLHVKDRIMYEILINKFHQNTGLNKLLLSTGDAILVEHTKNDKYWGDGGAIPSLGAFESESRGGGKNMLGRMLMEAREYIIANNL